MPKSPRPAAQKVRRTSKSLGEVGLESKSGDGFEA